MKFSIIIPTHNRADSLYMTLRSLAGIVYRKGRYEVIVVNNNSTDDTKHVVGIFRKQYPHVRVLLRTAHVRGPAFARNAGVRHALYDNIVFIDDDVIVPKNLLTLYAQTLARYPTAAIVGGKVTLQSPRSITRLKNIIRDAEWVYALTPYKTETPIRLTYPNIIYSANMYVNRNITGSDAIFNEKLGKVYGNILIVGEDYELCIRVLLMGGEVIYNPDIAVLHAIDEQRLRRSYVLSRFLRSGIEQSIIDSDLKERFSDHVVYHVSYNHLLRYIKHFFTDRRKAYFAYRFIQEILFIFGYFICSKLLLRVEGDSF